MRVTSPTASRLDHIICPFCESGLLVSRGPEFARCDSCALPLLGSVLETLRYVVGLPDALGVHSCECGHPEMRKLPDGVFHCPVCRSEVVPVEAPSYERNPRSGSLRIVEGETFAHVRDAAHYAEAHTRL